MQQSLFVSTGKRATLRKICAGALMLSLNLTGGLGALFLTTEVAYAATTSALAPTAVGNYNAWSSTSAVKVSAVGTDDGDTSYILTPGFNNTDQTFIVPGAGVPAGSTINSVTLNVVARNTDTSQKISLKVEKGTGSGNESNGPTLSLTGSYETYSRVMATNPFTSVAWTLAEVNTWTSRFGVRTENNPGTGRVTKIYVVVNYTAPTPLTITASSDTMIYGGTVPTITYSPYTPLSTQPTCTTTATASSPVGTTYTSSCTGASDSNYAISYVSGSVSVTQKAASVTPNAASKVYGATNPALTGTLTGFLPADSVTATYNRTAGETVAGSPYAISATLSPAGVLGNYTITSNTAGFTITPKDVTVTADAKSKTYGDADPALTYAITSGSLVSPDAFSGALTRDPGENVGTYAIKKGTLALSTNYALTYVGADLTISKKAASVTPDPKTKVYGDAEPSFTGTLSGFLIGDGVTATYRRTTGETVAGSPYAISAVLSPTGVLGNYTITYNTAGFTITPKDVTVLASSFTASNKVYDGNASATVLTSTLTGVISPDVVTLTGGTATFADANVGTGKTVTLTGATLGGADAGNYSLGVVNNATADITPLAITGNFTVDASKVYDGGTSANVLTRTLSGVISPDTVTLNGGTANYDNKNVGTGKTVTLTGATHDGAGAGNYTLSSVNTTTADITTLALTPSIVANNKVYDSNNTATISTRSLATPVLGDVVSLVGGTATFAGSAVGAWTVTETGLSLTGANAGNYSLTSTSATDTANITAVEEEPTPPTPPTPPSSGGGGGSSTFTYWGCTNPLATNYNRLANTNDGSCVLPGGGETTPPPVPAGEVLGASTSTPELPLPAACAANPYLRDYMRIGMKSDVEQVKLLQTFLNEEMGATLPVSGFFGPLTKASVKKLQKANHDAIIKPWIDAGYDAKSIKEGTGYVFKTTKRFINMSKCKEANIPMPALTL